MIENITKPAFKYDAPRLPCKLVDGVPTIVWLGTPLALRLRAMFPVTQRAAWQLEPAIVATGIKQGRLLELYYGQTPTEEEETELKWALDTL